MFSALTEISSVGHHRHRTALIPISGASSGFTNGVKFLSGVMRVEVLYEDVGVSITVGSWSSGGVIGVLAPPPPRSGLFQRDGVIF